MIESRFDPAAAAVRAAGGSGMIRGVSSAHQPSRTADYRDCSVSTIVDPARREGR
jgi:hypothetical protein